MKKYLFLLLMTLLVVLCSTALAQQELAPAATDNNQQQMLDQIQKLQKIQTQQQQQIQTQQTADTANLQGKLYANTDQSGANVNNLVTSSPPPNFDYPHKASQLPQTPQMQKLSNQAFSSAVQATAPMSPEQIHQLHQIYDSAQYAAAAPAGVPPKPTATSLMVNLSPGSSPPVIRLSDGFVTSLVFLDATGSPWPIAAYDLGNPSAFNIAWNKTDNILMIQAKTLYTYGNLAIRLQGLNTPIMLTLIPGQQVVDYRVDVTVPGYGPSAKQLPISSGLPPEATPILLDVLDGIPPTGSKQLIVADSVGNAWLLQDKIYIRTQYTLLSPGWLATMASADGTNAYELQRTPMVLLSRNGKVVHIKIEGF